MFNQQDFQEAFPGSESNPGPDYVIAVLCVVLALIIAVVVGVYCIPIP